MTTARKLVQKATASVPSVDFCVDGLPEFEKALSALTVRPASAVGQGAYAVNGAKGAPVADDFAVAVQSFDQKLPVGLMVDV